MLILMYLIRREEIEDHVGGGSFMTLALSTVGSNNGMSGSIRLDITELYPLQQTLEVFSVALAASHMGAGKGNDYLFAKVWDY